jgi:integrase
MRQFYLHTRNGVYYAELVTPAGRKLTARSTGTTSRDEALQVVGQWLKQGIPSGKKRKPRPVETVMTIDSILRALRAVELDKGDAARILSILDAKGILDISAAVTRKNTGVKTFTGFLKEFWDYNASPYVQEKKAYGHSIGRRHCYESMNRVRLHYIPAFVDRPLDSITRQDLKTFSLALKNQGYSPSSVNKILTAGITALSWAFREGVIPADPAAGLPRFSGETKKRGILTPGEAAVVFTVQWKNKRAYTGNLLSLTTGLRSGEILAVRKSDIGETVLHVRHSWSSMDGLKSPKNGEKRKVPLLPEIRVKLLELLEENPHQAEDPFVFYGQSGHKPMDQKILAQSLKGACKIAGIDAVARGIVFHSHRHYYAARMSDKMTAEQIIRITGHKSRAIFDEYADHIIDENLEHMSKAAAETFGAILR